MVEAAVDDHSVSRAVALLKIHDVTQQRRLRAEAERIEEDREPLRPVEALDIVRTWAVDRKDDGRAWALQRASEADEALADAQDWKRQVDADECEAAEIARRQAATNVDDVKREIFDSFDEYRDLLRKQADNEQPWAKAKLAEWNAESDRARKVIDGQLEPALAKIDARRAARRRKTRLIAEQCARRAQEAKAWKTGNAGQPENWPDNQRADVKRSLACIAQWSEQVAREIKPYGFNADVHVRALADVKDWTDKQAALVGASAEKPAKASGAKQAALDGVEHARRTQANLEAFLERQESEANHARDTIAAWVRRNNLRAKEWIHADSPQHRAWAEAWIESRNG